MLYNGSAVLQSLVTKHRDALSDAFDGCRMLPGPTLEQTMEGCTKLEVLDAQHIEVPAGASARLREACPALRTLLQTDPAAQTAQRALLESPEPSESGSACY